MDGVVRSPSLFSMPLPLSPSMIATQEFVVPRSMPMIFAIVPFLNVSFAAAPSRGRDDHQKWGWPCGFLVFRTPDKKKLTAKTPRSPSFWSLQIAFLGDLGV